MWTRWWSTARAKSPGVPVPDARERASTRVLILGGTGEARALARAIDARFGNRLEIVTSLAGRTSAPAPVPGRVRSGGFGGARALAEYLGAESVDLVVDATHPFAAAIAANARAACDASGVPRLVLARPAWRKQPDDQWHAVADMDAAAACLRQFGRRAFLTVGSKGLAAFVRLPGMWFLVRLVEAPNAPLALSAHELVVARGPFAVDAETDLMRRHRIEVLVTKASGGGATAAKLAAARGLGLPVVMVRRPPPEPGPRVASVEAAVRWIAAHLSEAKA